MKKLYKVLIVVALTIFASCTTSTDDDGDDFDAAKVCPLNGRGTFTDNRDGQVYKYTTIGNQVWMAENLKYDAEYSVCVDSVKDDRDSWNVVWIRNSCDIFGRYYSLQKDGDYFEDRNEKLIEKLCPNGWHLPTVEEWRILINVVDSENYRQASIILREPEYWEFFEQGTDDCGFSAYPAGAFMGGSLGLSYFETDAIFGTSSVDESNRIQSVKIAKEFTVFNNLPKMSIRCVKD